MIRSLRAAALASVDPRSSRGVESIAEIASRYDRVALVLQGGGALGVYQVGVYQALSEAGAEPDWISGVSIGAVNAAIIAGNPPETRMDRLHEFWRMISGRQLWTDHLPEGDLFRQLRNSMSALLTTTVGAPGFFQPRIPSPWLLPSGAPGATSYYDTEPLRATLERLVDFDRLNDGRKRISLGAVNVRTGNFTYFDSANVRIGPEHVMASGALPPGLPAVRIGNDFYWDGGLVSNTPLQYLLQQEEEKNSLVFQVDLFSARGELPRNMADVLARQKDIAYSSRTRQNTDFFGRLHRLNRHVLDALRRVPDDQLTPGERTLLDEDKGAAAINIVQLIYQQKNYETQAKDYEFSDLSMKEHWLAGYDDTCCTLKQREWLSLPTPEAGIVVHDIHQLDANS